MLGVKPGPLLTVGLAPEVGVAAVPGSQASAAGQKGLRRAVVDCGSRDARPAWRARGSSSSHEWKANTGCDRVRCLYGSSSVIAPADRCGPRPARTRGRRGAGRGETPSVVHDPASNRRRARRRRQEAARTICRSRCTTMRARQLQAGIRPVCVLRDTGLFLRLVGWCGSPPGRHGIQESARRCERVGAALDRPAIRGREARRQCAQFLL